MRDMKQGELILVDTTQVVSARSEEKASKARPEPAWSDVKANLADFDRAGLIALIKDLHSLSRDNRVFLDARLGLGADPDDLALDQSGRRPRPGHLCRQGQEGDLGLPKGDRLARGRGRAVRPLL